MLAGDNQSLKDLKIDGARSQNGTLKESKLLKVRDIQLVLEKHARGVHIKR